MLVTTSQLTEVEQSFLKAHHPQETVQRQTCSLAPGCSGLSPRGCMASIPQRQGENKSGTKLEMLQRKYVMVHAKVNYQTFTFKMGSWNSSRREWADREELSRPQDGETGDTGRAGERAFQDTLILPHLWDIFGRYLWDTRRSHL